MVGVITDQRFYAIVFAIGALWAIRQDGLDEWHVRGPRLLWVALAAGAGVAIGAGFVNEHHGAAALVILFSVAALVAGYIEASNRATAGVFLLSGTILGGGLEFIGKVWQSALAIALGALWVYAVAFLMNWRLHSSNQRLALARAFDALAGVAQSVGTPRFYAVRERAVSNLDRAHDVIGSRDLDAEDSEAVALRQCLIVALRVGEVISYLEGKQLSVDPSIVASLREIATVLKVASAPSAVATLEQLPQRFEGSSGLDPVVLDALAPLSIEELRATPLRPVMAVSQPSTLPRRERLRFALLLTTAVAAATVISVKLNDPHGFWLPFSVAFILRPDTGPVITRALARTVGTAAGVGIAALVIHVGDTMLILILLSCVMAAVTPWADRRSHTLAVMTFTPIVFVFIGLLGSDKGLFSARIIDTALAAGIVLIVDVAAWTTAPSMRPAAQVAAARAAAERYGHDANLGDAAQRNTLRRAALRAVVRARSSLSQSRGEPRLLGRHDPTSARELDDIERSIDAYTVSLLEGRR